MKVGVLETAQGRMYVMSAEEYDRLAYEVEQRTSEIAEVAELKKALGVGGGGLTTAWKAMVAEHEATQEKLRVADSAIAYARKEGALVTARQMHKEIEETQKKLIAAEKERDTLRSKEQAYVIMSNNWNALRSELAETQKKLAAAEHRELLHTEAERRQLCHLGLAPLAPNERAQYVRTGVESLLRLLGHDIKREAVDNIVTFLDWLGGKSAGSGGSVGREGQNS